MDELDVVMLKFDFQGVNAGTKGIIVRSYDEKCFEVEFVDSDGDTIDVLTIPIDVLEIVTKF